MSESNSNDIELPNMELFERNRKDSMESLDGNHFQEDIPTKEKTFCFIIYSLLNKFWFVFKPMLINRIINGFIIGLIIFLILYGNSNNMNAITGASGDVSWVDWYSFAGYVLGVNTIGCMVDILFFMLVDKYINGPIFYYIDTYRYQGSVAVALTVIATDTSHKYYAVPQSIGNWGDVMAAIVVI